MEKLDPIEDLLHQLDVLYGPLTQAEVDEGEEWYDQILQRLCAATDRMPEESDQVAE